MDLAAIVRTIKHSLELVDDGNEPAGQFVAQQVGAGPLDRMHLASEQVRHVRPEPPLRHRFDTEESIHVVERLLARLLDIGDVRRDGPGGGLFLEAHVSAIAEILEVLRASDQTLTHYGLTREQLRTLATSGRLQGVDRMAPVGQALRFSHVWDGLDLLRAFSRGIVIEA